MTTDTASPDPNAVRPTFFWEASRNAGSPATLGALAKARPKFKELKKSGVNAHLRNNYSTLRDMLEACGEALLSEGLQLVQTVGAHDGRLVLMTRLYYLNGEYLESAIPLEHEVGNPHGLGSWITYCRRYATAALLGLEGDWDDDGEAAVRGTEEHPAPLPRVLPRGTAAAATLCPECGGAMWDNREDKKTGRGPKGSPDFKCKRCGLRINEVDMPKPAVLDTATADPPTPAG